ncbi:hypothetical protein [Brachybacterium saurashtrense]|uniref:hypothetical protein n=1 Tax=Brachybacterium saurashtrense TaxID=556288 RepID=UPI001F4961ED|nr:hypothetical protein [Brachybacterium saurashtrense]
MTAAPTPTSAARTVDTTSLAARLAQAAMAIVLAIVSVLLMLTTHRLSLDVLGAAIPVGLLFGALFQGVVCVFLWAATGARLPLLVLGCLWPVLAIPFLGEGVGGGVLLPAVIAGQVQLSGWIVQAIGVGVPFLVAALATVADRRRSRAR